MGYYGGFFEYVPVAEKKRRAAQAAQKLQQDNPNVWPIVIAGRAISSTWWGKAWCSNLESYSDYSNRIARGRSYVRHGAVLDLQIDGGEVHALVQGSSSRPYKVVITVAPLSETARQELVKQCAGKISSLQELAGGKFPSALAKLFQMKDSGLFPSPQDIKFSCSCPDYAVMCKHVAAVLYGIGARFDDDSAMFFELRQVKMGDLITSSLGEQSREMLSRSSRRSARVLAEEDLGAAFGIELDAGDLESPVQRSGRKASAKAASDEAASPEATVASARSRTAGPNAKAASAKAAPAGASVVASDPAASPADPPPKRRRGRPPGSKNKPKTKPINP
ncbi:putative SWIM zinc finger-containing protein [Paenibacillus sp. 598K]|uniref:SWIM zinc finger family protein n=1 Tax=Paenibacillus sp. 598K TaxID=1117987 RepID=UPI000FFABAC0|nr:SWIM zinc finger family protein [Paenibacillus sp. 598K]GBF76883.1 putative SWIM zinc finger-containing protein [Paenibacillus sp. 598K]